MANKLKFQPTDLTQEEYETAMREVDEVAIQAAHIVRVGDVSCYPIPSEGGMGH